MLSLDVQTVDDLVDEGGSLLRGLNENVGSIQLKRLLAHPANHRLESAAPSCRVPGPHEHVAAAEFNFVGKGENRVSTWPKRLLFAVRIHNAGDPRLQPARHRHHLLADPHAARNRLACEPAKVP